MENGRDEAADDDSGGLHQCRSIVVPLLHGTAVRDEHKAPAGQVGPAKGVCVDAQP